MYLFIYLREEMGWHYIKDQTKIILFFTVNLLRMRPIFHVHLNGSLYFSLIVLIFSPCALEICYFEEICNDFQPWSLPLQDASFISIFCSFFFCFSIFLGFSSLSSRIIPWSEAVLPKNLKFRPEPDFWIGKSVVLREFSVRTKEVE